MRLFMVLVLMMMLLQFVSAQDEKKDVWMTDYDAGLELSKKGNKPMLLLFTGKGWCPGCIALEEQVFVLDSFKKFAKENLVCVLLNFGQDGSSSPRDRQLMELYGAEGFPSMFLVLSTGEPMCMVSADFPDPEAFIENLKKKIALKKNYEDFVKETDESKKKILSQQFFDSLSGGENKFYFQKIYLHALVNSEKISGKDKINEIATIYYEMKDKEEIESLEKQMTNLDPDNKFESKSKFIIKDFLTAIIAHDDVAAFKVFKENKTAFKGDELGYIYHFAIHMADHGKKEEPIEILQYIKDDPEIKTSESALKDLTNTIDKIQKK